MTAGENMRAILLKSGVYRLEEGVPLDWELAAYAAGFKIVEDALDAAGRDACAGTAGPGRLAQWEELWLACPAPCAAGARREILAARLQARDKPLALGDVPGLLLAAGMRGTAVMTDGKLKITVGEYLLPEAAAKEELGKILPLHIGWEVVEGTDG